MAESSTEPESTSADVPTTSKGDTPPAKSAAASTGAAESTMSPTSALRPSSLPHTMSRGVSPEVSSTPSVPARRSAASEPAQKAGAVRYARAASVSTTR